MSQRRQEMNPGNIQFLTGYAVKLALDAGFQGRSPGFAVFALDALLREELEKKDYDQARKEFDQAARDMRAFEDSDGEKGVAELEGRWAQMRSYLRVAKGEGIVRHLPPGQDDEAGDDLAVGVVPDV